MYRLRMRRVPCLDSVRRDLLEFKERLSRELDWDCPGRTETWESFPFGDRRVLMYFGVDIQGVSDKPAIEHQD